MPEDRNILIEDDQGNRYFPHTKASNVVGSNGKTAEEAINTADAALTAAAAAQTKANAALPKDGSQAMTGPIVSPGGRFTANPTIEGTIPRLVVQPANDTSNSSAGLGMRDSSGNDKWMFGRQMNNGNLILYDYEAPGSAFYLSPGASGLFRVNRRLIVGVPGGSMSLVGAANSNVFMEFFNNGTNRSAWIGTGTAGTNLLTVRNEVANEHIQLSTNGTGEVRVNGNQIWDMGNNAASKAKNGYQKLASGVIIQWGETSLMNSGDTKVVTFPIAFPTACVCVNPSPDYAGYCAVNLMSRTSATFNQYAGSSGNTRWVAIGY